MHIEAARIVERKVETAGAQIYYRHLWLRADGRTTEQMTLEEANKEAAFRLGLLNRYEKILANPLPKKRPKSSEL